MLKLMNGWAAPALQGFARIGDVSLFGFRAVADAFRRPFEFHEIVRRSAKYSLESVTPWDVADDEDRDSPEADGVVLALFYDEEGESGPRPRAIH